jgi:hypothetical protein
MIALALARNDAQINEMELEKILSLAVRAPSGDNCQPWRLTWCDRKLSIFHNEARGRHALNRNNHASYLALGCLIESIAVAAAAAGFKTNSSVSLKESDAAWAQLSFQKSSPFDAELANQLTRRYTERRPFAKGWIPPGLFQSLLNEKVDGCQASYVHQISHELTEYLCSLDQEVWQEQNAHRDLHRWLRFTEREVEKSRDGMPWPTLGINWFESRLLRSGSNFSFQRVLNRAGFLQNVRKVSMAQLASSAAIGCVFVDRAEAENLVAAGRLTLRLWLRLSEKGFALQPLTLGSLGVFDLETGHMNDFDRPQLRAILQSGKAILSKEFGSKGIPAWMFRTGVMPKGVLSETLRIDLKETLKID